MGAPYMWIALWDPDVSDPQLIDKCAASLRGAGARVGSETAGDGRVRLTVSRYEAFCPGGESVTLGPSRDGEAPGALVEMVVSVDSFDHHPRLGPEQAWGRLRDALGRLLGDTTPLLVVCPVEFPVTDLPDPPEDAAYGLFQTGWVNTARLDPARRKGFERALGDGRGSELGGGWWWSVNPDLDPAGRGTSDVEELTNEIYTAWTTRPVAQQSPSVAGLELPPSLPEVWLWSADRDEIGLAADVVAWAEDEAGDQVIEAVEIGPNGEPGWFPVVVRFEAASSDGIEMVRRLAGGLAPSWVAWMPESGIAVPGLAPDMPSTGVLPNVWVSDRWIGPDALSRLDGVLAGAHRERLSDGTLFVTDPGVLPDGGFDEWCYDPAARWDRLVEAASILADRARENRSGD